MAELQWHKNITGKVFTSVGISFMLNYLSAAQRQLLITKVNMDPDAFQKQNNTQMFNYYYHFL